MEEVNLFLGGTCNGSLWREELIPMLEKTKVSYFNPVVDDWNEEAQKREEFHRQNDDFVLYCITPKMTGVYSIAEVVDDSNKRPSKTIFVVLDDFEDDCSFSKHQLNSLKATQKLVEKNGTAVFSTLKEVVMYIAANQ